MAKQSGRAVRPATFFLLFLGLVAFSALVGACSSGSSQPGGGSGGPSGSFPVEVHVANGNVTIRSRPKAIVSLSPTATEMLAAIGARSQLKAVDEDSDYPPGVPRTKLNGNEPNVEAIAAFHPDLVVMAGDTTGLVAKLAAFKIPVLSLPAASTLSDTYTQLSVLGQATGHVSGATAQIADIRTGMARAVSSVHRSGTELTYYYELDQTYYSVTSSTFIGSVLGMLGLKSIADPAANASDGGYPQLSAEYIISANPDFIFLADSHCCGQSAATVAARPGWSALQAVTAHRIVVLNDDVASRWGPRIVDLASDVAKAVNQANLQTGT
jgi:iron complex transport system substrate-binding protein